MAKTNQSRVGKLGTVGNINATLMELNPNTDKVVEEVLVTTGFFTGDLGVLSGSQFSTASNNASNDPYYFDVTNGSAATAKTQFSVAYGHYAGSGSDCLYSEANDIFGPTQVVYNQFAEFLLAETEITGGFHISSSAEREDDVYVIIAGRENMQDAVNRKTWTLVLSGSATAGTAATALSLTDDSATTTGYPTMYGLRYNIRAGALGVITDTSASAPYGHFYPNLGIWVLSGKQLSASIPGTAAKVTATAVDFNSASCDGFGTYGGATIDEKNALRLVNGIADNGSFRLRNEEFQQSVSWFCRVPSKFMNFSSNPAFISGSENTLRHKSMIMNPQTFITTIGLYNVGGEVVATAKLSSPLQNNFGTEVTIKVKLTY